MSFIKNSIFGNNRDPWVRERENNVFPFGITMSADYVYHKKLHHYWFDRF